MTLKFASCLPPTSQKQFWLISTAWKGGPFDATKFDPLYNETSEHNTFGCPCFKSLFAICSLSSQRFHYYFTLA